MFVLHHILFCQKQAFCCSFAFSSSLWINSISNAFWREVYYYCCLELRASLLESLQPYDYFKFWRRSEYEWGKRIQVYVALVFLLFNFNSVFFILEYCNNVIFVEVPIFLLGTKVRKIQKVFLPFTHFSSKILKNLINMAAGSCFWQLWFVFSDI